MTAPALILLAHGSTEPQMAAVLHQLRVQMQQARPELNVNLAFVDRCPPSGPAVVQAPRFEADVARVSVGTENKTVAVPTIQVERPGNTQAPN